MGNSSIAMNGLPAWLQPCPHLKHKDVWVGEGGVFVHVRLAVLQQCCGVSMWGGWEWSGQVACLAAGPTPQHPHPAAST